MRVENINQINRRLLCNFDNEAMFQKALTMVPCSTYYTGDDHQSRFELNHIYLFAHGRGEMNYSLVDCGNRSVFHASLGDIVLEDP